VSIKGGELESFEVQEWSIEFHVLRGIAARYHGDGYLVARQTAAKLRRDDDSLEGSSKRMGRPIVKPASVLVNLTMPLAPDACLVSEDRELPAKLSRSSSAFSSSTSGSLKKTRATYEGR
jgi:hypothetical protein